jgi:exodeoxyribonuclease V alpha subunit
MARFLAQLDPDASPLLLLASAVLVQMEGRGHSCLPLALWVQSPHQVLSWPSAAEKEFAALWDQCPRELAAWVHDIQRSPTVEAASSLAGHAGATPVQTPLVLTGPAEAPRLYLRRYWQYECDAAQHIARRMQSAEPVHEALARDTLDRMFDASRPESKAGQHEVNWQKLACALALRSHFSIITGGPGTGKTYTAARLLALLFATHPHPGQLRVMLAAPTGKAAARLKQSIDLSLSSLNGLLPPHVDLEDLTARVGPARTLHSLLGARSDTRAFRHDAAHPLDVDVLMVDEASMVHLEMMVGLLKALPSHARLVLLGDKDQLASVEAGALLGDLCRYAQTPQYDLETRRFALEVAGQRLPEPVSLALTAQPKATAWLAQSTVMLRKSHRFEGPIGQLALAVNQGDASMAMRLLAASSGGALASLEGGTVELLVQLAVQGRVDARGSYQAYCDVLAKTPKEVDENHDANDSLHLAWVRNVLSALEDFRVLCAVREGPWGVQGLNQAIARQLSAQGQLKMKGEWYTGRPIMVTRNDPSLGVFNGDIGVVLPAVRRVGQPERLRAWFLDGDQLRSVAVTRLAHVETAFAMTVHKSQGSEYGHAVLVLPQHAGSTLSRELVYTGITRAKKAFTLVTQVHGLFPMAIEQVTQRASGLLDFLEDAL